MNKKRISDKTFVLFFIFIFLASISTVATSSDWSQFQSDWEHTALTQDPVVKENPETAWSVTTSMYEKNGINAPPIIADDLVYIYTTNGSIWAFDKNNGDLVWRNKTTGGSVLQSSTPAYGNGKIFVASNSGNLFAFDGLTGEELWNEHVTDSNFECPITYFDHMIYVGDGLKGGVATKYYYCYDENGQQLWKYANERSAGFLWNGACVIGDFIVYPTHEGKLVSLDKENGGLVDEIDLTSEVLDFAKDDPGMFRSSVTYNDGFVYTTSERGQSLGYVWKIGYDNGKFINNGWCTQNGFSTSTPAIHDGKIYVGQGEHGYPGNLTCLEDSTGNILWSYFVDAGVKSSPALALEGDMTYIYFTGAKSNGSLYCLKEDGSLAWEYNPPDDGYILQGAAISDGKIYFGTDGGYLYCIQESIPKEWKQFHKDAQNTGFSPSDAPDTNNILWASEDIGAVQGSSPVIADSMVYVNCGDYVKSLDQYTGEFLKNHSRGSTKYNSIASPAYHNGSVWCGLPDSVNSGTTVADGKLFEGEWDGHYYCFDEVTGEELWNFSANGNAQATPAYEEGRVYFTSWEYGQTHAGYVYCVDSNTGDLIWGQSEIVYNCCSSPTIYGNIVYVTTYNFYGEGEIYALNKNNGSILWKRSIHRTDSTPTVAYGNVYVSGGIYGYSDLQTYCFDATTGDLKWNTTPGDGIGGWLCSVAVADEKVFVGTALETEDDYTGLNGTCALDAFTGELIWNSRYGGSSPAVSDGMVFTIADGRVYAFGDAIATGESTNEESAGFELSIAASGLLISAIYMIRRKRKE
ncbi:PQQ-binding-like beta-propeller repeat protein [Methanococcoides sp. NM1]|uniref:outer membrane protein assembly factor BamB family protein n=1 Tax=Methanococcoides sp. NM1 TaxID=1201013 RepID=UPI001083769A|nr:PQQ-binding-like beta-propeller repeat protein [Methanococcoides sp. NM1]